jgi:hypothetical protein
MSHDIEGGAARKEKYMKCMILTYASQQDYDGTAGHATDLPAWSPGDFAAAGAFMEAFNRELVGSGELIETRAMAAPVHTRRLGAQNNVATDGPVRRNPGGARRLLNPGRRQLRPGDRNCRPACALPRPRTCGRRRGRRRIADRGIRRRSFRLGREALTSSTSGKGI